MLRENDLNSFAQTRKRPVYEQAAFQSDKRINVLLYDDRQLVLESVVALMRSRIADAAIRGRCHLEQVDFEPAIIVVLGRSCSTSTMEALTEFVRRFAPRSRIVAFIDASEREQIDIARSHGVACVQDLHALDRLVENARNQKSTAGSVALSPAPRFDDDADWQMEDGGSAKPDILDAPAGVSSSLQQLTPREREVLERLDRGLPNKIIAYELGISCCTVKVHIRNILQKFKARNRTQAAFLARQRPFESFVRT